MRAEHEAELQKFGRPGMEFDLESVEPAPDLAEGITLAHAESIARDPNIGRAARRLVDRGAVAVAYGCTSGSYVLGIEGEVAIVTRIEKAAGVPSTTTSSAMVAALREVGAERLAVLSPHLDALNERLRAYLHLSGFSVINMVGLNRLGDIEGIEPEETRMTVESRVDSPAAEAIFISCTGMRTAEVIDDLEQSLGKPVISANQATLWHVAKLAGSSNMAVRRYPDAD